MRTLALLVATVIVAGAGTWVAAPDVTYRVVDPTLGPILTDASGRSLYTWDRDTDPNVSTCTGQCLTNWPLFTAAANAVASPDWTIVTRDDGGRVWSFRGDPLYYFARDTAPGQVNGNQPAGTWHVVPLIEWTEAGALGTILTDAAGRTLYTWDRDTEPNVSTCTGNCLTNWPLLTASANDVGGGDWTIVTRPDGARVWAYRGDPLYYYAQDTAPGQTAGNQPAGTWHVITAR
jgi:predicted lipoprotein with Yx(FWY)xxD motif